MASVFARGSARVIASAAAVLSSQLPSSSINNAENDQEPGSINQSFRQLSSKEVGDAARTIFGGKNESTNANNTNTNNNNNNGASSIQVFHASLNPVALALGQQLAEDPRIQQSIYEHMKEKWSLLSKGGGVEKEVNLSDAEDEEFSGIHSPILSDIEGEDWSHLSRNQIILSPELFQIASQSLPLHASNNNDHHEGVPANHQPVNQQQHQTSSSSSSTDSLNNQPNHNNPHPENKNNEEIGIIGRFVRWIDSLFTPPSDGVKTEQRNNATNQSSSSSNVPPAAAAAAAPTDIPSRLKNLLGNIEIYQMAIAVAAMIVFVAIFRRPPPRL